MMDGRGRTMNGERKNHGKERTGGRNLRRELKNLATHHDENRLSGHPYAPPLWLLLSLRDAITPT